MSDAQAVETNVLPEDYLTLEFAGHPMKLFMSFNLLQEFSKEFPSPEQVVLLPIDPLARAKVLIIICKNETTEISIADAEKLIAWVSEHLINFFVRQAASMQQTQTRLMPFLSDLKKHQEAITTQTSS